MVKRKFSDYHDKRKVNAWCPSNPKTPEDYSICSNDKFKFICFDCNHTISISLEEKNQLIVS